MRFLVRLLPKREDKVEFLASAKAIGLSLGLHVRHPRWTSYGALEVDVFAPSVEDSQLFLAAIEPLAKVEFSRNLDLAPQFKTKEEVLREAVGYFNAERYWECHEALEPLWRNAKGPERSLLQGIILVCAAQVHEQRGERDVALGIYRRYIRQLAWPEPKYHGIDVGKLKSEVEASLAKSQVPPLRI